ncbi:NAPDH-dependent diflavin reductase [Pseudogymnoascus verrucosus]|uniref:NADPH-dependent diflavin oxidoreductase 1 n=1 Tax=Pseudogymnoascus verrucosus TaxID=342668 RepID=A0A1B8G9T6_9PEZI|nr:NAPDH-dependent diflavin reductase [Pseudogymnoascus verrucosus]OBT92588.2 NAPDH-dependent diflavin reductase [Pseudogymnoascus verrucosus]
MQVPPPPPSLLPHPAIPHHAPSLPSTVPSLHNTTSTTTTTAMATTAPVPIPIPFPPTRHERSALILYASETGTSEDAAHLLGGIAQRLRFATRVAAMDGAGVNVNELRKYTIVVFAVSTTGQGEFPANGRKLWKSLLRKSIPAGYLRHVDFTTFGFGDQSYVKFNWAARKLHRRLQQLGANEVYARGEGDEQHDEGTDGAFIPWSLGFKKHLVENYPLPDGIEPIPDEEFLPPKYILQILNPEIDSTTPTQNTTSPKMNEGTNDPCLKEGFDAADLITDETPPPDDIISIPGHKVLTLTKNIRITAADHFQDVRHIVLEMEGNIHYEPGDVLTLFPKNFPADVNSLIDLQGWTSIADKPLQVIDSAAHPTSPPFTAAILDLYFPVGRPPTLRDLLTHNLDITAIPRRSFLGAIAHFTDEETHKTKLQEFSNPAYTDEYFDYTTRPRRSILEILHDFPTVHLPFQNALALFPRLRGRQFSISSGGALRQPNGKETTTFHLTIALVRYRTVLRKVRQGVCSRYIASLQPGTPLACTLSDGSLNISAQDSPILRRPLLMIAPGTGVAPMRSLIWERSLVLEQEDELRSIECGSENSYEGAPRAKTVLIFGGRNRNGDFLYEHEWRDYKLGVEVLAAWSRDQREKVYVQDVIRREAALVWAMLRPWEMVRGGDMHDAERGGDPNWTGDGTVIVCGSSGKMPVAVRKAIVDVFELGFGGDKERAEQGVRLLEREGRYLQETW